MTEFVEIPGWEEYLPVREDRIGPNWRPRFILLPTTHETDDRFAGMSDAEYGRYVRVLTAHANSPLRDPGGDPRGPRRLDRVRAERTPNVNRDRSGNGPRALIRLEQKDRVRFVPDTSERPPGALLPRQDGIGQNKTKSEKTESDWTGREADQAGYDPTAFQPTAADAPDYDHAETDPTETDPADEWRVDKQGRRYKLDMKFDRTDRIDHPDDLPPPAMDGEIF